MTTKVCPKCGEEKDITEFYVKNDSKDGRDCKCKSCAKKYNEEYRSKNQEKLNNLAKIYRINNRDAILERKRKRYSEDKTPYIESVTKYSKTPKGKLTKSKSGHKRRTKFKETPCTLTLQQWEKILESQDNRCAICGKKFCKSRPPTKDHIIPLSKGGGLTFENVQALCKSCNSSKNASLDHTKIITWSHHGITTRTT